MNFCLSTSDHYLYLGAINKLPQLSFSKELAQHKIIFLGDAIITITRSESQLPKVKTVSYKVEINSYIVKLA